MIVLDVLDASIQYPGISHQVYAGNSQTNGNLSGHCWPYGCIFVPATMRRAELKKNIYIDICYGFIFMPNLPELDNSLLENQHG